MPQPESFRLPRILTYITKERRIVKGKVKKNQPTYTLLIFTQQNLRHLGMAGDAFSGSLHSSPVPRVAGSLGNGRDDRGWVRRLRSRLGLEELAISQPGTQPRAPPPHHAKIVCAGDPGLHPITRKSRVLGTPGCATRVSRDLASCCAT